MRFLSTPSARRATGSTLPGPGRCEISIHALREEGDEITTHCAEVRQDISIHALREEGDEITTHCAEVRQDISIHALREEGDP